jgi:DNA-binding transcriptional LysR family regulator
MDLSQVHIFLTVAREQSFSRAAEKLYRTQPAVSIVIRKLEEPVGHLLLGDLFILQGDALTVDARMVLRRGDKGELVAL